MSNLLDLAPLVAYGGAPLRRAEVAGFGERGEVQVAIAGIDKPLACQVLNPDSSGAVFSTGDAVLVWLDEGGGGVVLGRIGPHAGAPESVVGAKQFAARPEQLVFEAQGDIVLRNGQARLRLGAQGDVEIVCNSFATRSQRLLRLLAPLIKLN